MSSRKTRPGRRKRNRGSLAAAFVVMLVVVAILLFLLLQGGLSGIIFPPTTTTTSSGTGTPLPPISISLTPTATGKFEALREVTTFPVTLKLQATPTGSGPFRYLWGFGDGTSSAKALVTHVFPTGCIYHVSLKVVDGLGGVTRGTIQLLLFTSEGAAGTMDVCPQQGTAGITRVVVGGGFYPADEALHTLVNGSLAGPTIRTDDSGDWALNYSRYLSPQVNGSVYTITTQPHSVAQSFLTLEGIRASPTTGEPGDPFTLVGRSYPAFTTVRIYMGATYVGQEQSDGNGSFLAHLQVPAAIHYAGKYQFVTFPPVLGASATFTVPRSTTTPAAPGPNLWWLVVAAVAAAAILVGIFLWRRRLRINLEVLQEMTTKPFSSLWAIRVTANRRLDGCRMTYGDTPLRTVASPTDARLELALPKGGSLTFRIPESVSINEDARVAVLDGDRTVASERFGSIPRTNPQV